jgi:hypothetical protein
MTRFSFTNIRCVLPGAVSPHGSGHKMPGEDVVAHAVAAVQQDAVHSYTWAH